MEKSVEVDKL